MEKFFKLERGIWGWHKKETDKIRMAGTHKTVIYTTHI